MRRRVPGWLLALALPLAASPLAACTSSGGEGSAGEQLAGYGILFLFIAAIAVCIGLVVLAVGGLAFFAGATTLALNVLRPTRGTRIAGVVVGAVDVAVGAVGLLGLGWLVFHRSGDHVVHVDVGGYRALLPVLGVMGLGVANFVMSAFAQRPRAT